MITGEKVGDPALPNCYKAYSSDLISSLLSLGPSFVCSLVLLPALTALKKPTGQLKGINVLEAGKGLSRSHMPFGQGLFLGKLPDTSDLRTISVYTICQLVRNGVSGPTDLNRFEV